MPGISDLLPPQVHLKQARQPPHTPLPLRLAVGHAHPAAERRPPEFGSDKDFQLQQALNQLKGLTVLASKTQTERPAEKQEK